MTKKKDAMTNIMWDPETDPRTEKEHYQKPKEIQIKYGL